MPLLRTLGLGLALLCSASCSRSKEALPPGVISNLGSIRLQRIEYGRLVEVYGLSSLPSGERVLRLWQRDVLIDPLIEDARRSSERHVMSSQLYDFIASDPETRAPRLLIRREIGSVEFTAALKDATSHLRTISFGRLGSSLPVSMVPRDAAIKLSFDRPLKVNRDFFERRDANGIVTSLKNGEAIRIGVMDGDPDAGGRAHFLPVRYILGIDTVLLDPVLTGFEGPRYGVPNRADGLPASDDSESPNLRLALALSGPLKMVGLVEDQPQRRGASGSGQDALICDFRAGNRSDESLLTGRGFMRERRELTLAGELPLDIVSVTAMGPRYAKVEIHKQGASHEIDGGDHLRIYDAAGGLLGRALVVAEPSEDEGEPGVQVVSLLVESMVDAATGKRPQLGTSAMSAILEFEFTAVRDDGTSPDDPRSCFSFGARIPLASGARLPAAEYVAPTATIGLQFNRPVDPSTVDGLETFFVATRKLLDRDAILAEFIGPRGLDPAAVTDAKFRTPHLVASRVVTEGATGTKLRITPVLGLYLDDEIRKDEALPFAQKRHRYYVHLLAGPEGITDRSGMALDFGLASHTGPRSRPEHIVVPFSLDTRRKRDGQPMYADNRVVYLVRRFAAEDEDERPSIYLDGEIPRAGQAVQTVKSMPSRDLFGAVTFMNDGRLLGRPTSRIRRGIDAMLGQRIGACPSLFNTGEQIWSQRGTFSQGLSTPLNHYGSRLQTVYREIDLGLSFSDPHDFDLDVEGLFWAPFKDSAVAGEEFPSTSLYLGHAESRPEPCIGRFSGLLTMPGSGLQSLFADNYAGNLDVVTGAVRDRAKPHPGYERSRWLVDPNQAIADPSGRGQAFLPFPKLQKPYFVWRDQTSIVQGGNSQQGSDVRNANQNKFDAYLPSPFAGGQGRVHSKVAGTVMRQDAFWGNFQHYGLRQSTLYEQKTGGGLASIALPLLLDLWTYPDPGLLGSTPPGGIDLGGQYRGPGDISLGLGWQVSIFTTSPMPVFRSFSGGVGAVGGKPAVVIDPSMSTRASAGYDPNTGNRAGLNGDNANFWLVADFLKRQTVAVSGFVELNNPHRMPSASGGHDPRLGPFGSQAAPDSFIYGFDPVVEARVPGTQVRVEFRAAGAVDDQPWRWLNLGLPAALKPSADNFPLDPLKAGDAQVKKFDDRLDSGGVARSHWTQFYNKNITEYRAEPESLFEGSYLAKFSGPRESFGPEDVKYINWRFTLINDSESQPPKTASLDAFWLAYRIRD